MFPNQDKGGDKSKKPADKGGKPESKKQGPGAQHELHHPAQGGPPGQMGGGPPMGGAPMGMGGAPMGPPSLPQVGPKPGQGMNPQEAMMFGLGDISHLAPPPPPPMAPMGPGGMPVGANLASSDPMMDPAMNGSGLFKALNMALDPYSAGPMGHAQLDPPPDLNSLLAILALQKSGLGAGGNMNALNPSGVFNEPTHPGEMINVQPYNVIM